MLNRYKRIEYTDRPLPVNSYHAFDPMQGEEIEKAILSLPEGYRIVFLLIEVAFIILI